MALNDEAPIAGRRPPAGRLVAARLRRLGEVTLVPVRLKGHAL
jgi:hypothetical protein